MSIDFTRQNALNQSSMIREIRDNQRDSTQTPMLKVIQISVASGGSDGPDYLYALCSDGSLWLLKEANTLPDPWIKLPPPPDENEYDHPPQNS